MESPGYQSLSPSQSRLYKSPSSRRSPASPLLILPPELDAEHQENSLRHQQPQQEAKPHSRQSRCLLPCWLFLAKTKRRKTALVIIMLLTILGAGLAGLAALPHGTRAQTVIDDDAYFYGQSPPVYPSPNATGTGSWASAFVKAKALVGNMTLEEKVSLTAGIHASNGCSGKIPSVSRLGFPGMCLSDAGNGLRGTEYVSGWPAGVAVAASWNKDLARKRAAGMGAEYKKKGVNVLLGPVVGPMGRTPLGGRNWEGFSPDPSLTGALVYETVQGVQGTGVMTSVKHFIGNEQETIRNPLDNGTAAVSSNMDDKTMHELYLWPFQDAVRAGTANIMCSYNRLNNSYGCANSKTLNGLLKTELGFQGFVVADWGAQHAGVATALAGLDMAMPDAGGYWGANLSAAITNGSVAASRVDDMAIRILASWYQLGQDADFSAPGAGMPADTQAPHEVVDARDPANKAVLLAGAIEGHVLLKNTDGALPLGKPGTLSVFGYSARSPDRNTGRVSADGSLDGWPLGTEPYDPASQREGSYGPDFRSGPIAAYGTLYGGGGSGAITPTFAISPFDALVNRAYDDDTNLYWDFTNQDPWVPYASDACLVFINAYAAEGQDRGALYDDGSDGLVLNVAAKCNNTMVVIHNAAARLVDRWIEHENVTALMYAHYPGQSSGKALVSLLYGDASPSGRLPYTVARNESDYGVLDPDLAAGEWVYFPQSNFSEGVLVDYRYFDAKNITPRYAFGFGMSYTTFEFSDLAISKTVANSSAYPTGAVEEGGQLDLWDELVSVTASVANTGRVDAYEVAQLYLGIPSQGGPARQLRAFEKPYVAAGESAGVTFSLTRRDLSVWDVVAQKWYLPRGDFTIEVGPNSRDLPLAGSVTI